MSKKSIKDTSEAEAFLMSFHRPDLGYKECVEVYNSSGIARELSDSYIALSYKGPEYVANMLAGLIPDMANSKVLDLAAGPGFIGTGLHKRGFINIDALDGAEVMVEIEKQTGIYRNCFCSFIDEDNPMPMEDNTYDAIGCSGATILNHLPPSAQREIVRVIKPGGFFVNAYRDNLHETEPQYAKQWHEEAERLEKEGKWTLYGQLYFKKFITTSNGLLDIYQKN